MPLGGGEVVLILLILFVAGFWIVVPVVGILSANRRLRERRHSVLGVVLPIANLALIAGSVVYTVASGGGPSLLTFLYAGLSGIWLWASLRANRAARPRSSPA